jgi:hypothetical protein
MSVRPAYRLRPSWLALIGFSVALILRMVYVQKQLTRPVGHLTAQQVLEKSEPLCHALAPEITTMVFYVESSEGPFGNCWSVSCRDETDQEVVNLTWDADAAELCMVGVELKHQQQQGKQLGPRAAVQAARYWLDAIGFAAKSPSWHLLRPPIYKPLAVAVEWQGVGRQVYIHLNVYSGDLLNARMWHDANPHN